MREWKELVKNIYDGEKIDFTLFVHFYFLILKNNIEVLEIPFGRGFQLLFFITG
jgi:hypothetical protein